MNIRSIPLAALMLITLAAMAASARADDGWFGGLNPWSPNYSAHANKQKSSPYIGSRVVNGSKNIVGGARDLLPWRRAEKRKMNEFVDGTGRFFRPDLRKRKKISPASAGFAPPRGSPSRSRNSQTTWPTGSGCRGQGCNASKRTLQNQMSKAK